MLQNGNFEGVFTQREAPQIVVAEGWVPFYHDNVPPPAGGTSPVYRPEYKAITRAIDAHRMYDDGDKAQAWFKTRAAMDAGVLQRVSVPVGAKVTFTARVQAWCSDSDDPRISDAEMYFKVGIDPSGGTDAFSDAVVWDDDWFLVRGDYVERKIAAFAQAANITVFVRAWNKWAKKHNDAYVDTCTLLIEGGTPPPEPPEPPEPPVNRSYVVIQVWDGTHTVPLERGTRTDTTDEGIVAFVQPTQGVVVVALESLIYARLEV